MVKTLSSTKGGDAEVKVTMKKVRETDVKSLFEPAGTAKMKKVKVPDVQFTFESIEAVISHHLKHGQTAVSMGKVQRARVLQAIGYTVRISTEDHYATFCRIFHGLIELETTWKLMHYYIMKVSSHQTIENAERCNATNPTVTENFMKFVCDFSAGGIQWSNVDVSVRNAIESVFATNDVANRELFIRVMYALVKMHVRWTDLNPEVQLRFETAFDRFSFSKADMEKIRKSFG